MLDHLGSNDQLKSRFQLTTSTVDSLVRSFGFVIGLIEVVTWVALRTTVW